MISRHLRKSLRRIFKRGRAPAPARSPKLHRTIAERGSAERLMQDKIVDGHLGVYWSGTSYCDGVFPCESTRVLPAPSPRNFGSWVDKTDPGIEGPCCFSLFAPTNEQITRGY